MTEKKMIINNNGVDKVDQGLVNKTKEGSIEKSRSLAEGHQSENKNDKVELSSNAVTLNTLSEKVGTISEIRQEKVDRIKQSVDDGSYKLSSEKIADKILDEGLGLLE